jgi:ATP-binding cassette subfamily B protein
LFSECGYLYEHNLFLQEFMRLLKMRLEDVHGSLCRRDAVRAVPAPMRHGIELCGVSFRYPGSDEVVLRDVSFSLAPRQTVAVVGANGAGKTTLIKLLTRCYDPTEGAILLDGRDYRDYELESLRRNLGVIFQDFVKYDLTARENVAFGQIEDLDDTDRIWAAVRKAEAASAIEKLPHTLETYLGKTFEHAVDLSGGEWQKLALARASRRAAMTI